jgi:hypothetical protein
MFPSFFQYNFTTKLQELATQNFTARDLNFLCLWSWNWLLEKVLKDGCYEVRILCNPIGLE